MAKKKNGRQYLFLVIATFVVFSVGFFVTEKSQADVMESEIPAPVERLTCEEVTDNVRSIIAHPSPCNTDSDCVYLPIACSMGCPAVNRTDEARISAELGKRPANCICTMEACIDAKAYCESGVCKSSQLMPQ